MVDQAEQQRENAKKVTADREQWIRKQLEASNQESELSRQDANERLKGKPTPTQEENDLAALGAHVQEKEHDGSAEDPNLRALRERDERRGQQRQQLHTTQSSPETRAMESRPGQGQPRGDYATRTQRPSQPGQPSSPTRGE
jgi:hypothetical protein